MVEETGVTGENHRPVARHWQTLSHSVASSTPRLSWVRTHNVSSDTIYHTITITTAPYNNSISWKWWSDWFMYWLIDATQIKYSTRLRTVWIFGFFVFRGSHDHSSSVEADHAPLLSSHTSQLHTQKCTSCAKNTFIILLKEALNSHILL